jgi:predicted deacylase
VGWYGLDRSGSGKGLVVGSCEHGNELSGSIKCWKVTK